MTERKKQFLGSLGSTVTSGNSARAALGLEWNPEPTLVLLLGRRSGPEIGEHLFAWNRDLGWDPSMDHRSVCWESRSWALGPGAHGSSFGEKSQDWRGW